MPRHLHVWLAADLYNKVSVLIGLGDNTIACHMTARRLGLCANTHEGAPANSALAPSIAGRLNAKRYAPVVVQMSRVGGSSGTSELGPFTP
jgi:hypothetical protein